MVREFLFSLVIRERSMNMVFEFCYFNENNRMFMNSLYLEWGEG